jgi:hypothetical protein
LKNISTADFIENNSKKNSTAEFIATFFVTFYRIFQGRKQSVEKPVKIGGCLFFINFLSPENARKCQQKKIPLGFQPSTSSRPHLPQAHFRLPTKKQDSRPYFFKILILQK